VFHLQLMMRESPHEVKTPDEINRQFDHKISRTIIPQGTAAVPAIPLGIFLLRLAQFDIPRTLCQILRKEPTFQEIEFRYQQIAYVQDIAEGEHDIPILINALAREFECPRSHVQLAIGNQHSRMAWSRQDSEGSMPPLMNIVNNKLSIEFNKKPNKACQSAKRKSKITARVNSNLQSLAAR
jgi:hypothetical protein